MAPLLLMGYYNPFLAYGLERFAADASAAALDGVIVPDLPVEEGGALSQACQPRGIDLVYLAAPTSTPQRLAAVTTASAGFVYCVSVLGVTGSRTKLSADLPQFVRRVRALTATPLAVGFGISRPEHVAAVARIADGAAVGSGLIDLLERTPPAAQVTAVRAYASELRAAAGLDGEVGSSRTVTNS